MNIEQKARFLQMAQGGMAASAGPAADPNENSAPWVRQVLARRAAQSQPQPVQAAAPTPAIIRRPPTAYQHSQANMPQMMVPANRGRYGMTQQRPMPQQMQQQMKPRPFQRRAGYGLGGMVSSTVGRMSPGRPQVGDGRWINPHMNGQVPAQPMPQAPQQQAPMDNFGFDPNAPRRTLV